MSMLELYLMVKANSIQELFAVLAIITGIILLVGIFLSIASMTTWYVYYGKTREGVLRNKQVCNKIGKILLKYGLWLFPTFLFIASFMPNTKELVVIYLVPKIVNNEQVQGIASDSLKLMKMKMDQWLHENIEEVVNKPKETNTNKEVKKDESIQR